MQVVDLMTVDVITVTPETPIKEAARHMFRNRVSGLPVVDEGRRVIGMITEADFLQLEVQRDLGEDLPNHEHAEVTPVETVGDAMSRGIVTVNQDMPLTEAAKMMAVQEIKRLPVVDEDDILLGIISRLDVVAAYTRPDEVIEDEIREDLIRRVLFIDPEELAVTVDNGVVTLGGEVGTKREALMIAELTRRLDGVMRVENDLTFRIDDTG